ncbi:hypothetical protein OIU78_017823 [Salix suchowensis]|nr:hypothetical protein OIU78_017823 [Salix suchowensis]
MEPIIMYLNHLQEHRSPLESIITLQKSHLYTFIFFHSHFHTAKLYFIENTQLNYVFQNQAPKEHKQFPLKIQTFKQTNTKTTQFCTIT